MSRKTDSTVQIKKYGKASRDSAPELLRKSVEVQCDAESLIFSQNPSLVLARRLIFFRTCKYLMENNEFEKLGNLCCDEAINDPYAVAQVLTKLCVIETECWKHSNPGIIFTILQGLRNAKYLTDVQLIVLLKVCVVLLQEKQGVFFVKPVCEACLYLNYCLDICGPLISSCATAAAKAKRKKIVDALSQIKPLLDMLQRELKGISGEEAETLIRVMKEITEKSRAWKNSTGR